MQARHIHYPINDAARVGREVVEIAVTPNRSHARLVDPVLPLLSQSWQRDRLVLGDNGNFALPSGGSRADMVAIDLVQSTSSSITRIGQTRITLGYDPRSLDTARAALVAGAAHGGWPIAGDTESLALLTLAERIAASEIPVLLEGPTGTGKEVFARFVHRMSRRADGPFIAVNCAAMPEAMLEGLLFGHRKGAFTGAGEAREGLFRAAHGGTLLLDEIGELPLALQAKLLRTLQEGEVLPLGATTPVSVDVRIVAATNRVLTVEVEAGRFREDLLYRLNVFPLVLPPLRERRGDIAPLAFGMLLRHAGEPGGPNWISGQALASLEAHHWAGNVRELENVMRRAILLAGKDERIGSEHIVFDQTARAIEPQITAAPARAGSYLSDVAFHSEAQAILRALDTHGGHRGRTARSLGISERTLRYRLASMRESGLIAAGAER
ncbi:MAG: sigma-54 interaction domain-containing protein [Erythrobacter sp.]